MTSRIAFRVGVSQEQMNREIVAECEAAVAAAARGDTVEATHSIHFETWADFFKKITPNRIAILEHVEAHESVASMYALAKALDRSYPAVHADVIALVELGLLHREGNELRSFAPLANAEMVAA